MGKWFLLLLVLAVLVGFYWTVGSGTFADRNIHMHLQRAASAATEEQISSHITAVKDQIVAQRVWVDRLKFVARRPDMSHIENAEKFVDQVASMLQEGALQSVGSAEGGEQAEEIAQLLRSARVSVRFFRPEEQRVWTVVFWILAIGAGITGLLSFVRSSASF